MKRKIFNLIAICAIASAAVIGLVILVRVFPSIDSISYPYRYRECEPEKLLPDLERTFDINFPTEINNVKTARTPGSWDGTGSSFAVKFPADPTIVGEFLESFPKEITFEEYEPRSDTRYSSALHTPPWFTQAIAEGKVGAYSTAAEGMGIYIDTTDKNNFIVYLKGHYERSLEEIQEELKQEQGTK